jgi:two-component system response regulator MprA
MPILVVDDDPAARNLMQSLLTQFGFRVECRSDGASALALCAQQRPLAVVLDLLMPKLDGLDTCRALRARGERIPVLMLTARDAVSDRVDGLDAGADDYVVKPFSLEELLARVRALLRRSDARGGEREVELTKTEFALLEQLLRHPRQVLSRSQLFEAVWGYDFGPSSNSLEVYIGYLRRKTEAGGEPRLIQTVRGVGYALREK